MKQLKDALKLNSKLIDDFFRINLPKDSGLHLNLIKAMKYSLIGSGKKIRGFLVLESGRMILTENGFKVDEKKFNQLLVAASAIESIHTYSLIHDDLPSMDNSDFRRGKKSNHIMFDEATAILAGDALQSWAFELISNPNNINSAEIRSKMILNLARRIGMSGMVAGQQADIDLQNLKILTNDISWIQEKKTGSLLECCVIFGYLIGNGYVNQNKALINYAKNLGIAFQIADDLLDLKGSKEKIGKPVGQDLINNTPNFINLLGEHKARKKAELMVEKALGSLKIFGNSAKNLVLLAKYAIERDM